MPPADNDTSPFGSRSPDAFAARIIRWTRKVPDRWISRRFAFALRRLAIHRLRGRPLDVEALGAQFRLYPYNNMCEKRILFTPQYFDPAERAALGAFIDAKMAVEAPITFVDVGANVGGYALFVGARAAGRARVLAVEPQPVVFERLCFNIAANPGCGVKALSTALADREGPLTLFLAPRNKGESSVKVVGFEPGRGASVSVPATTLNRLLAAEGISRIDAMKVDVEGAEDLVLVPFFRDAPPSRWPDLLILANTPGLWHSDLDALLQRCGYAMRSESRLKRLYDRRTIGSSDAGTMSALDSRQPIASASTPAAIARSKAMP